MTEARLLGIMEELLVEQKRTARELTTIRQLVSDAVNAIRAAEAEIPEAVRRFMNYFHDAHDIKYMYEEHGVDVPQFILREIERLHDRYRQILQEMHNDGNAFDLIRREMAKDTENRYDHTRQLSFKGNPQ